MASSIKLNDDVYWDGQICDTGDANGGHYIKFANGLMICTKSVGYNTGFTGKFGTNNGASISMGNHAVPFVEIWSQTISPNISGGCVNCSCVTGLSNTSIGTAQLDRPAGTGAKSGTIYVTTIGRWK